MMTLFSALSKYADFSIPIFKSNRVTSAFGRAVLQHFFEFQQIQGHKFTMDYDSVPTELYLNIGRAFLEAYAAKRFLDDRVDVIKESFIKAGPFIVNSDTKQPYFTDSADMPSLSESTSPENIAAVSSAVARAVVTAAESGTESSSTLDRQLHVLEREADRAFKSVNMSLVTCVDDLCRTFIGIFRQLVNDRFQNRTMEATIMSSVRFVNICSLALSFLNEKYNASDMQEKWGVIERKERDNDTSGIGLLAGGYTSHEGELVATIAQNDKKYCYIERVEELTDSASGWVYSNRQRHGEVLWKRFSSESEADTLVTHSKENGLDAVNHKVANSPDYLVMIQVKSIPLENADQESHASASFNRG